MCQGGSRHLTLRWMGDGPEALTREVPAESKGLWSERKAALRVCDLFAGLGGFSCGALEAGAEVVLAIDSDPVPLKLLGANSPQTITVVATLGKDPVKIPPAGPDFHIHMSTPCTELSIARRGTRLTRGPRRLERHVKVSQGHRGHPADTSVGKGLDKKFTTMRLL